MRKRRTIILLLVATFVVVGFKGRAWLPAASNSKPVASLPDAQPAVATTLSVLRGATREMDLPSSKGDRTPPATPARAKSYGLSADATALVAEMCDLQLAATGTDLVLSSRQWSALASVVLRTQAVRQTYEARIATSTMIEPGRYRVEIPVYAGAGDALRANFHADLQEALGGTTAAEVVARLGGRLEARFAGFGVSAQTLDVIAPPGGTPGDFQVTRTVTYWNSIEGADHPTTRREIHFPAWEDPTGDSWSALLALVKT